MKNKKKNTNVNRLLSTLLLFTMLLTLLSGCGNNNNAGNGYNANDAAGTENITESSIDGNNQSLQHPSSGVTAMGRYVEQVTDLSDKISGHDCGLYKLADGNLVISDAYGTFLISKDNGETWEEDNREWRTRMLKDGTYIWSLAVGADNTAAVIYHVEDAKQKTALLIIRPDGTEVPANPPLLEDDEFLSNVWITDSGRIFASALGNSNIYEIKEDGSSDLFLSLQNNAPELIQFQGNLMIMDGSGYKSLLIYDIEKKEYIEDEVLEDFMSNQYKDSDRYAQTGSYQMYFFPGEDGVLYLAGDKGLHRHVIGGSAIEQVIDGNLCTFSNPAYSICGMIMLENNVFLTLFSGGRLARFVYDSDVSTVPNEKLKVYSLKESTTMQQAIAMYQTIHPEAFVEYEIGIEKGSSVTREDALKSLNTEIMAGEGPDILVLDEMPLDSYIEKGLLQDLRPLLDGLSGEEALFENIVDAMKTGDKIYAMPCEIGIPVVAGEEKYISQMKDLEGIAGAVEEARLDKPEKDLLYISTPKGIMRFFSMSCVPAWKTADGDVDKETIGDFLTQTKRIYDAQMDGLPEKAKERYDRLNETWVQVDGEKKDDSKYLRTGSSAEEYVEGTAQFARQDMAGFNGYAEIISINRVKNFENTQWTIMNGQSSHVFCAETLVGINAASNNIEQAEDFVKMCLGKENQTQSYLYDGFPVNKAAFEDSMHVDESLVGEDGAYWSMGGSDEEGNFFSFTAYVPDDAQIAELRSCIEAANTAYIEDVMLEGAVYEAGIEYLNGRMSLQEAIDMIQKKVAIYLAE